MDFAKWERLNRQGAEVAKVEGGNRHFKPRTMSQKVPRPEGLIHWKEPPFISNACPFVYFAWFAVHSNCGFGGQFHCVVETLAGVRLVVRRKSGAGQKFPAPGQSAVAISFWRFPVYQNPLSLQFNEEHQQFHAGHCSRWHNLCGVV